MKFYFITFLQHVGIGITRGLDVEASFSKKVIPNCLLVIPVHEVTALERKEVVEGRQIATIFDLYGEKNNPDFVFKIMLKRL